MKYYGFLCVNLSAREMFRVLEAMKMDMANFTIQQIRPYLQQQSVNYERTKFQQLLKSQEGKSN